MGQRAEQFAAVVAGSLAHRRVLCDLLSAQAGVLEHNVSPQVAARYKRAAVINVADIAAMSHQHLPELGDSAPQLTAAMIMAIGAVWTHARPSQAMLAAYEADPSLAAFKLDFVTALHEMLATLTWAPSPAPPPEPGYLSSALTHPRASSARVRGKRHVEAAAVGRAARPDTASVLRRCG
ncbi:hypothetical protein [Streptomyces sp. NPDC016845]|uniref:hypothetical protein n=1 Tax=Streptomyces sp. NPDC016845 TaxID=3364972 RepID=UPI00379787EB